MCLTGCLALLLLPLMNGTVLAAKLSTTLNDVNLTPIPNAEPLLHESKCLEQLDATVALATYEKNASQLLQQRFAQLESQCGGLPQLAHNQGVLAAQAGHWPEAIAHLERSLLQDSRAAMTYRHLQQIFEHRAAQAYAKALNTPIETSAPTLKLQTSDDQNAQPIRQSQGTTPLHSLSTLEYEMFAWWQAVQNSIGIREHYVADFPETAIKLTRKKYANHQWADMHREIAFTANDAVVIVSDPFHNRTLFLLRLVGNRWKIYQETTL